MFKIMNCSSLITVILFLLTCNLLKVFQTTRLLRHKNKQNNFISELKNLIDNTDIDIDNEEIELTNYAAIFRLNKTSFNLTNSKTEIKDNMTAEVYYYKTIFEKGWDKLSTNTYRGSDEDFKSPFVQAYMAGYLEGRLTMREMETFLENTEYNYSKQYSCSNTFDKLKSFFKEVDKSMYDKLSNFEEIYEKESDKNYYYKIYIFYSQLKGLLKGYNKAIEIFNKNETENPKKSRQLEDILIIQADGEISELLRALWYKIKGRKFKLGEKGYFKNAFNITAEDPKHVWGKLMTRSRCSAMIKILKDEDGNYKDLLAGHATWEDYSETYRIFKHNYMELSDYLNNTWNIETTFSSYPGCLSSTDDYYITNNKLFVAETTLEVIDINLYKNVKKPKEYIPNFMRVNSATFFSKTAEEWVSNFSYFNSGTYSSQWMILDYKVFEKINNESSKPNKLLFLLEQTPNSIVKDDISNELYENSYFASFNRAFFIKTHEELQLQLVKELYGDIFTFHGSDRGKIFKTLQGGVKSFKKFKDLMRYNGYKMSNPEFIDDPSLSSPSHGISSRFDLETDMLFNLSGGVDCKLTNTNLIKELKSIVISGPSTENNPNLPVFRWDSFNSTDVRHEGLPNAYNFQWLMLYPDNLKKNESIDFYNFTET